LPALGSIVARILRCALAAVLLPLAVAPAAGAQVGGAVPEAAEPVERMALGNAAYERAEYFEAVDIYRSLLDEGYEDPDLYYNLANAYLKAELLGWAILNYERALRLAPRDADVEANLAYARSRMVDIIASENAPWLVSALASVHHLLGVPQTLWLTSTLWFAVAAVSILGVLRPAWRNRVRILMLGLVVLVVLSGVSAAFKIYDLEARAPGIVVVEEVQVMSGPGAEYAREFVLHAGTGVEVKRAYRGWLEVALSEEMRGWVSADAVEPI